MCVNKHNRLRVKVLVGRGMRSASSREKPQSEHRENKPESTIQIKTHENGATANHVWVDTTPLSLHQQEAKMREPKAWTAGRTSGSRSQLFIEAAAAAASRADLQELGGGSTLAWAFGAKHEPWVPGCKICWWLSWGGWMQSAPFIPMQTWRRLMQNTWNVQFTPKTNPRGLMWSVLWAYTALICPEPEQTTSRHLS